MNQQDNQQQPPAWLYKFLQWRLPEEQFEEVQGVMQEFFRIG